MTEAGGPSEACRGNFPCVAAVPVPTRLLSYHRSSRPARNSIKLERAMKKRIFGMLLAAGLGMSLVVGSAAVAGDADDLVSAFANNDGGPAKAKDGGDKGQGEKGKDGDKAKGGEKGKGKGGEKGKGKGKGKGGDDKGKGKGGDDKGGAKGGEKGGEKGGDKGGQGKGE